MLVHNFQSYGPQCRSPKGLARGVTNDDINEIIAVHNKYRSQIARGVERRGLRGGPQPPAANMELMVNYHTDHFSIYINIPTKIIHDNTSDKSFGTIDSVLYANRKSQQLESCQSTFAMHCNYTLQHAQYL